MADVTDTTITPTADQVKQGTSYGYPGLKSGTSGADIQPSTGSPVNNKSAK